MRYRKPIEGLTLAACSIAAGHAPTGRVWTLAKVVDDDGRERKMLCGAPSVAFMLAPGKLARLLDLTRPVQLVEPKAIEHLEMTSIHLY